MSKTILTSEEGKKFEVTEDGKIEEVTKDPSWVNVFTLGIVD